MFDLQTMQNVSRLRLASINEKVSTALVGTPNNLTGSPEITKDSAQYVSCSDGKKRKKIEMQGKVEG